jgi:hypothetical protein
VITRKNGKYVGIATHISFLPLATTINHYRTLYYRTLYYRTLYYRTLYYRTLYYRTLYYRTLYYRTLSTLIYLITNL